MSTLDDYIVRIRDDMLLETPFVESEMTDKVIKRAIERAIGKMDSFRPKIIRTYSMINAPGYTMLRTYTSRFDDATMYNFNDELGTDIGDAYVYAKDWTLDELIKSPAHHTQYRDLVVSYSCLFMANYRRTAGFSNTPFDLKGDQFYQEFKESHDKLIELLQNTSPNNY
jgi:hypothetical protein